SETPSVSKMGQCLLERKASAHPRADQAAASSATHLGLARLCDDRINEWELHDGQRVVVGRDPVIPLEPATQAAMDDHLLSRWPCEEPNRCHQRATVACPVARRLAIDMA